GSDGPNHSAQRSRFGLCQLLLLRLFAAAGTGGVGQHAQSAVHAGSGAGPRDALATDAGGQGGAELVAPCHRHLSIRHDLFGGPHSPECYMVGSRVASRRGRSLLALAEGQQGERGGMAIRGLSRTDRPVAGVSLSRRHFGRFEGCRLVAAPNLSRRGLGFVSHGLARHLLLAAASSKIRGKIWSLSR